MPDLTPVLIVVFPSVNGVRLSGD